MQTGRMGPLRLLVALALMAIGSLNAAAVAYTFRAISGDSASGDFLIEPPGSSPDAFGFNRMSFQAGSDVGVLIQPRDYLDIPGAVVSSDETVLFVNGGARRGVFVSLSVVIDYGNTIGFVTDASGLCSWVWSRSQSGVDYSMSGTGIWLRSDLEFVRPDGETVPEMGSTLTLLASGLLFIAAACVRLK